MAEKRKRSTGGALVSLLGWAFGLFFFLSAIAAFLYANLPNAIASFLAGLLIFPYTYWKIVDPHLQLGVWGRIGLAVLILVLAIAFTPAFYHNAASMAYGSSPGSVQQAAAQPYTGPATLSPCDSTANTTTRYSCYSGVINQFSTVEGKCSNPTSAGDANAFLSAFTCLGGKTPDCGYFTGPTCLSALALQANNTSLCPQAQFQGCVELIAAKTRNDSLCNLQGVSNSCFNDYAKATGDVSACYSFAQDPHNFDGPRQCITRVVLQYGMPANVTGTICNALNDMLAGDLRWISYYPPCVYRLAAQTHDSSVCNQLYEGSLHNNCVQAAASNHTS